MERRSRSQGRRLDNNGALAAAPYSRHASSSRADPQDPRHASNSRADTQDPRHASSSRADSHDPRHASSSRVDSHDPRHARAEPQDSRTLSPDRKDRYRSSGRAGNNGFPNGMYATDGFKSGYAPSPEAMPNNLGIHSNANSYNQYDHQGPHGAHQSSHGVLQGAPHQGAQQLSLNAYGEVPPPRPTPPTSLPPAVPSPAKQNNSADGHLSSQVTNL